MYDISKRLNILNQKDWNEWGIAGSNFQGKVPFMSVYILSLSLASGGTSKNRFQYIYRYLISQKPTSILGWDEQVKTHFDQMHIHCTSVKKHAYNRMQNSLKGKFFTSFVHFSFN